jgi:hypothetical protein
MEKELLQRPSSSNILNNGGEEESDPNFDRKLEAVTAGGLNISRNTF